ncbi:MAG TPA: hypothetical protein VFI17_02020 [Solirubrobacterales bacterium]|nr:hypothetical protein [Solirubrobacterales bacterium]
MRKALALPLVLALLVPVAASAGASDGSRLAAPVVSPQGVGAIQLGATVKSLHRRHLIGRLRPGCELDPGQRVAPLRPPLRGFAIFSHPNNRVSAVTVTKGAATARGIGIGSTPKAARQAYPKAEYDPPGTADPFPQGFLWVNSVQHPKMTFVVDPGTHKIIELSVPAPNFCE